MDLVKEYTTLLERIFALKTHGIKPGLDNTLKVLAQLNNPQQNLKAIHIAGTNGKGSTAAMLESVMREGGYTTGIFTSPHLEAFNERIRVNGQQISDDLALATGKKVLAAIEASGVELTFFEIVTVMAFCIFDDMHVDYAILETGMGGRLDATNVVVPKVAIITNVDMDHAAYLGETIEKIALEKAGIIKTNVPIVTAANGKALDVIKTQALEKDAPISIFGYDFEARDNTAGSYYPEFSYFSRAGDLSLEDEAALNALKYQEVHLSLAGKHQIENAACVLRALEYLNLDIDESAICAGLASTEWPGRLEIFGEKPLVLLDGAHNVAGMQTLVNFLNEHELAGKVTLVTGILADKQYDAMLKLILPLCKRVIFTKPENERALEPETLATATRKSKMESYAEPNIAKALELGFKLVGKDEVLCITGSLYLVGAVRELMP